MGANDKRRERQRQWRRDNPEKEREYRRDYLRKKYLAEFITEKKGCVQYGKAT